MPLIRRHGALTSGMVASLGLMAFASGCGGNGSTAGTGGAGGGSTDAASTSSASSGMGGSSSTGSSSTGSTTGAGGGSSGPHLAEWVRAFIGSEQIASAVATDTDGNVYVGGSFANGSVDFGDGQRDCPVEPGNPRWCGFLVKLDPTGKTLWSRAFVGARTRSLDVKTIAIVGKDVVIAAPWQRAQIQHMPLDLGTGLLDPPGDNPMVIARFDAAGKPLWSAAFGDDAGEVVPTSLLADGPSGFVLGGEFSTATLNLGVGAMPFISAATLFLAHFEGNTATWQKSFGGMMPSQHLAGVGRAPNGNLSLGGYFEQSLDFGGPTPLVSQGTWSVFRATLDATGKLVSDQSFDGTGSFPDASGAAVDADGSTLVTGYFDGSLAIGAKPLMVEGDVNAYLAKIDAKGQVVFSHAFTDPMMSDNGSFCVAADAKNNVLWGADLLFVDAQGNDRFQGRITKLSPTGEELWSVVDKNFGVRAFAFDGGANVVAVGEFSSEIDFAKSGKVLATKGTNAFIAKFAP